MNFLRYQTLCKRYAIYPNIGNNIYYPTLGLVGEAGEVANKIKKVMRDDLDVEYIKIDIKKELGDILWYISTLATELNIDLNEIAEGNIYKLEKRKLLNKLGGKGDNR